MSDNKPILKPENSGDQAVQNAFRLGFLTLRLIMVFIFLAWLGTGVYQVKSDEQAVEFFLGQMRERDGAKVMDAGLYWTLPFPFSRVIKIKTKKEWDVKALAAGAAEKFAVEPKERTEEDHIVTHGRAYQVTSDLSFIHTGWEISYRIKDLELFVKNIYQEGDANDGSVKEFMWVKNANQVLLAALSSSVISESRKLKAGDILTTKEAFHKLIKTKFTNELERMGSGIEIVRLKFTVASVPSSLINEFRRSSAAKQIKEQQITKHKQLAAEVESRWQEEVGRLKGKAKTDVIKLENKLKSRVKEFLVLKDLFDKTPGMRESYLKEYYMETVSQALKSAKVEYVSDEERVSFRTSVFQKEEGKNGTK